MQYIEVTYRYPDGREGRGFFKVWHPHRLRNPYYIDQLLSAAEIAVVPTEAKAVGAQIRAPEARRFVRRCYEITSGQTPRPFPLRAIRRVFIER